MAIMEHRFTGDFDTMLNVIHDGIMQGSLSASYEGGSDYATGGIRCAVRVYERYSYLGGNRVSLNVTLVGNENELFISAITAGGSQALVFKINTWGEEAFLDKLEEVLAGYL